MEAISSPELSGTSQNLSLLRFLNLGSCSIISLGILFLKNWNLTEVKFGTLAKLIFLRVPIAHWEKVSSRIWDPLLSNRLSISGSLIPVVRRRGNEVVHRG